MRLCINIDHIATLRQARGGSEPDPLTAAQVCERAGADGIVCHLREDRRHINDRDLRKLRQNITTKLDLEMAATEDIIAVALATVPELATLVPERRQELTTEGGLDVSGQTGHLKEVVRRLHEKKIQVSLFVDPVPEQITSARAVDADIIEIHTGEYANAQTEQKIREELERIRNAATFGVSLGLGVNAGHGLNYLNIAPIRQIEEIHEVSIGHAIISRAVLVGLDRAVREMRDLIR